MIGCDPTKATLSDYLLRTVLEVLSREAEHPKHLLQYFQLFVMYAGIGAAEVRTQFVLQSGSVSSLGRTRTSQYKGDIRCWFESHR